MARASILTIGDEILIGQIVDTNSSWLGQEFTQLGIQVIERRSVADAPEAIERALEELGMKSDLVFCTGGLGPTQDDQTKQAICNFFDTDLYFDEENYAWIKKLFAGFGREPGEAHRIQAHLPAGCTVLHNARGTAPGMLLEKEGATYVFTPGVPYEMKSIFTHSLQPILKRKFDLPPIEYETLHTAGVGESILAERISDLEAGLPESMSLAYLPHTAQVRLRLLSRNSNPSLARVELDKWSGLMEERLGPKIVFGRNGAILEKVVGAMLQEQGLRLTLAESCTGGAVAKRIVSVPGSSAYYMGSIVSYSNESKQQELGVEKSDLISFGAVSQPVVEQMVRGALSKFHADVALSISGIAGPDGGSEEKPVGTVWMAVGNRERVVSKRFQFGQNRELNIEMSVTNGLNMIRKFLLGL